MSLVPTPPVISRKLRAVAAALVLSLAVPVVGVQAAELPPAVPAAAAQAAQPSGAVGCWPPVNFFRGSGKIG